MRKDTREQTSNYLLGAALFIALIVGLVLALG
jgi:hypothetical protein